MNLESYNSDWLPYWKPDTSTPKCNACDDIFSLFNRKHHCRKCGKIFCFKCWGKLSYVKAYNKEVPVCHECYDYDHQSVYEKN